MPCLGGFFRFSTSKKQHSHCRRGDFKKKCATQNTQELGKVCNILA